MPRTTSRPGVSRGTRSIDCWRCRSADGSVLPITMKTLQLGFIAPVIHHLRPLRTYSSPSRTIDIAMLVASDDATSGSVMAKAERMSPLRSGSSHCSFCSSVPKRWSTSMLPVSGAAQFIAAGARWMLRPEISARAAYCRLVRPAPSTPSCSPGRKRFHSPRRRASARISPMTGAESHAQRSSSSPSCSWNTVSAGCTTSSMKASIVARSSSVRASNPNSITSP